MIWDSKAPSPNGCSSSWLTQFNYSKCQLVVLSYVLVIREKLAQLYESDKQWSTNLCLWSTTSQICVDKQTKHQQWSITSQMLSGIDLDSARCCVCGQQHLKFVWKIKLSINNGQQHLKCLVVLTLIQQGVVI